MNHSYINRWYYEWLSVGGEWSSPRTLLAEQLRYLRRDPTIPRVWRNGAAIYHRDQLRSVGVYPEKRAGGDDE